MLGSSVLAKRLHAALELSLPSCSHGFRAGESAQSAMAATFLSLQNASLEGQHMHLVTYDICKCFDSLPWQAVSKSLQTCGVNQQTAAALLAMWTNLRRIWKTAGSLSDVIFFSHLMDFFKVILLHPLVWLPFFAIPSIPYDRSGL